MTIQVLGSGCPNCRTLEANLREALANLNMDAEVEKVTDMDRIVEMGVMITPALAINNEVVSTGKVLKEAQLIELLKEGSTK